MKKFYFLGICGISMSALAMLLKKEGNNVCGSDINYNNDINCLKNNKICVFKPPNYEKIKESDVIVVSSAISENDKELMFAKANNKKIISRGQLLGDISSHYEKTIAIAGSHGKTTTTALIYNILKVAGKNPTLHLGGELAFEDTNCILGEKEYFITEACEYKDNFLFLKPYISVITNIEPEHLDYFQTFKRELLSFSKFESNSKIVIKEDKSYKIKNVNHRYNGFVSFDVINKNNKKIHLDMKRYEEVIAKDCIYAIRVCKELGIRDDLIKLGIESYKGVKKRFQKVNCQILKNVYVDYAHHPTEIQNAIKTAKKSFKNKKIVVIFQPHTYSRTKLLFKEFIKSLSNADEIILYKTYSAREEECMGLSEYDLYKEFLKINKDCFHFSNINCLLEFLKEENSNEKIYLFLGAGDLPDKLNKISFLT